MNAIADLLPTSLVSAIAAAGGSISFEAFMSEALYSSTSGYYTRKRQVLGREGDFITAPELTDLFGATVAQWMSCQGALAQRVLEFGPGRGLLARQILHRFQQMSSCVQPTSYSLLEVSGTRVDEQRRCLVDFAQCQWLAALPQSPFEGIVLANEVLDALPVQLFRQYQGAYYQGMVSLANQQQTLALNWQSADDNFTQQLASLALPEHLDYQSEINQLLRPWFESLAAVLARGVVWICDYGFPRQVYYHPDRNRGTLMCHYQQQVHTDPFVHVGQQDITTHVDFTAVAEAADAAGFDVAYFGRQADFLIANGLLDLVAADDSYQSRQAAKMLMMPQEMGELFCVMVLTKNYNMDMTTLHPFDRRHTL